MALFRESEALKEALEQFRDEFKSRLSTEQRRRFRFATLDELEEAIYKIQEAQAEDVMLRSLPRIQGFLEAMKSLDRVVKIFLNTNDYLGFIWGPIKLILEITGNFANAFNAIIETYSEIGAIVPALEKYEALFKQTPYLQSALVDIYKTILEFHMRAIACFQQKAWKKLFHAVWNTFKTQFRPCMKQLKDNYEVIRQHAQLEHYCRTQEEFKRLQEQFEAQKQYFEHQRLLEDDYKRIERDRRHIFIRQWLSADDAFVEDQDSYNQTRGIDSSSGHWLLQKTEMKKWMTPEQEKPSLVWMTGQPGAGKTILTSLVVHCCQKQFGERDETAVLWFYCKHADVSRDNLLAIARSLIWQVYRQNPGLLDWLYEEALKFSQAPLTEKRCKDILLTAFESMHETYVIIDGVDECCIENMGKSDRNEPRKAINFFRSFLEKRDDEEQVPVYILLSSQDDNVCPPLLSRFPTVRVTQNDNHDDISAFTRSHGNELQRKFDLPEEQVSAVVASVATTANGMFLFAVLAMRNLMDQIDLNSLQDEVRNHLPSGIDEAYERILYRITSCTQSRLERVLHLLGIIGVARRPLKWREIQGVFATDPEDRTVDHDRYRLAEGAKELCSSLINVGPSGNVEFVHRTAKQYLTATGNIDLQAQQFKLVDKCLCLLSGTGFDDALPRNEAKIEKHMLSGYYAFADYAVVFWAHHVKECIKSPGSHRDMNLLGESLEAFLQHNMLHSAKRVVVNNALHDYAWMEDCTWQHVREIGAVVDAADYERQSRGSNNVVNRTTNLMSKVQNIRTMMEKLSRTQSNSIVRYYGKKVFKCPRLGCEAFAEGFLDAQSRQNHVLNHEKPWRCSYITCLQAESGFSTEKELEDHLVNAHDEQRKYEQPDDFPPRHLLFKLQEDSDDEDSDAHDNVRTSGLRFVCNQCPKEFTRKMNLDDHVSSWHKGEKPHRCEFCNRQFSRRSDRNRHENGYHRDKLPFECTGKLGSQLYDGETWGCGRAFPRSDKLSQHYIDDHGTDAGACIEPLVKQCRLESARLQFRCSGSLSYRDLSSDKYENEQWGCGKAFKSSATLKKHWKSKQGRTVCLKRILEGKESPPADEETNKSLDEEVPSQELPLQDLGQHPNETEGIPQDSTAGHVVYQDNNEVNSWVPGANLPAMQSTIGIPHTDPYDIDNFPYDNEFSEFLWNDLNAGQGTNYFPVTNDTWPKMPPIQLPNTDDRTFAEPFASSGNAHDPSANLVPSTSFAQDNSGPVYGYFDAQMPPVTHSRGMKRPWEE